MHKYMHQVVKYMDHKQLYEARWMNKPRLYNLVRNDKINNLICHLVIVQNVQPVCLLGHHGKE